MVLFPIDRISAQDLDSLALVQQNEPDETFSSETAEVQAFL